MYEAHMQNKCAIFVRVSYTSYFYHRSQCDKTRNFVLSELHFKLFPLSIYINICTRFYCIYHDFGQANPLSFVGLSLTHPLTNWPVLTPSQDSQNFYQHIHRNKWARRHAYQQSLHGKNRFCFYFHYLVVHAFVLLSTRTIICQWTDFCMCEYPGWIWTRKKRRVSVNGSQLQGDK